ncbi:MAG: T9SS type A sorting domain-containing protein, partial [Leadbetterella sp.]
LSKGVSSTKPIRIRFSWKALRGQKLAETIPSEFVINFPGAQFLNLFYPIALAEKLSGKDLNSVALPDIECVLNSSSKWNYASTGTIAVGFSDLETVVMHEILHGIGLYSSVALAEKVGSYGVYNGIPTVFDNFLVTSKGSKVINNKVFGNPSEGLGAVFISDSLFWLSPADSAKRASFTHMSFSRNVDLDPNALHIATKNANRKPILFSTQAFTDRITSLDSFTTKILQDIGWISTSISHEPLKNSTRFSNIKFEVDILSNLAFSPSDCEIIYRYTDKNVPINGKSTLLKDTSRPNGYTCTLNFTSNTRKVEYYFKVKNVLGQIVTAPAQGGFAFENYIYGFSIEPKDTLGPSIEHFTQPMIMGTNSVSLTALVQDKFEGDPHTVSIHVSKNGGPIQIVAFKKYNPALDNINFSLGRANKDLYVAENVFNNLTVGDKISYFLEAKDVNGNISHAPYIYEGDFPNVKDPPVKSKYELFVTNGLRTSVADYGTRFEDKNDEWSLNGFSFVQPDGFSSKGLHSDHPYKNGKGSINPETKTPFTNFENNDIALLRTPIRLDYSKSIIFDEVVLVEPQEKNASFGSPLFYDYVIVEASLDGNVWFPVKNGYNSGSIPEWESLYRKEMTFGNVPNSRSLGEQRFFKTRKIDLKDLSYLGPNAEVLFRFRIFSNQYHKGWGWSIDNLYIQKEPETILSTPIKDPILSVFPNPASEKIVIKLDITQDLPIELSIYTQAGKLALSRQLVLPTNEIDIKTFPEGIYTLVLESANKVFVKKVVKLK